MKISLIILAAGNSKRFGSNKLLHEFEGKPLYIKCVETMRKAPFYEKIIVTQYDEILCDATLSDFIRVRNDNSELGISHSIKLGIESSSADTEAWCFTVCDQPFLQSSTLNEFISGFIKSEKEFGVISCDGVLGNPNIFAISAREALLSLVGDRGGKNIINRAESEKIYTHCIINSKELSDVDFKEDLFK